MSAAACALLVLKPHAYGRGRPPPTIIGEARDVFGEGWNVRERRPTAHGFNIEIGWPEGSTPGPGHKGVGAPRVIVTESLASYLFAIAQWKDVDLPLGHNVLSKLRKRLELGYGVQREKWWQEHLEELKALGHARFACKYGLRARVKIT